MQTPLDSFLASNPAASITLGFEVFVQEVIAAISTSPWPKSTSAWGNSSVNFNQAIESVGCSPFRFRSKHSCCSASRRPRRPQARIQALFTAAAERHFGDIDRANPREVPRGNILGRLSITTFSGRLLQERGKLLLEVRQLDPILGTFGSSHTRTDVTRSSSSKEL